MLNAMRCDPCMLSWVCSTVLMANRQEQTMHISHQLERTYSSTVGVVVATMHEKS